MTKKYLIEQPYYSKGVYRPGGSIVEIAEGDRPSHTWKDADTGKPALDATEHQRYQAQKTLARTPATVTVTEAEVKSAQAAVVANQKKAAEVAAKAAPKAEDKTGKAEHETGHYSKGPTTHEVTAPLPPAAGLPADEHGKKKHY